MLFSTNRLYILLSASEKSELCRNSAVWYHQHIGLLKSKKSSKKAVCGIEDGTSVTSQPVQVNQMEEFANWRSSVMALHKCIFFLITILGLCLQLMFTTASPFVLDYRNTVLMRLFIIDISAYCGSFGVMILQTNHSNADFGELMNNICLLLGTLASILELLILFPPFGWITLFFWIICFVTLAFKSYRYSKTLCERAVAALVVTLGKFRIVKLIELKGRLMESSALAGLRRAYEKLKDMIKRWPSSTEHDEINDQRKELAV